MWYWIDRLNYYETHNALSDMHTNKERIGNGFHYTLRKG